ncbi:hypothetical protein RN001_012203 [Aquatica leii]|uniref:Phospholipase A-2-activating protein n=1 Tax=Aquatica leii TaxID=1421715 RepID=A0AAN7P700_9COLE|nr:hypothetical protein RN001_012203 [Aquatica leii]
MSKPFKLSASLHGHSLDVRSISVTSKNGIISGSRDKTAKLWIPNEFSNGYIESMTYKDQKNFVGSVLHLEPTPEFPGGLVITGGNDHVIFVYKTHEPFSTMSFKEHSNTVCCLSKGIELNTFLSSSWDNTAKLWNLLNGTALATFSGHTAAIWSVIQLHNKNVVTASADKTIGIFSKEGFRINTLQGHTDCVRDLADFPELKYFISVSNDASIKVWSYDGSNLDTYYGHTNYIYSICRNNAGGNNCFVTSDEDRTVRYWKDGLNTETFQLPAQSVWKVACLSNGDIVTGSSDSVVRIFTQDESRIIGDDALKAFEDEVSALTKQSMQEIGGYKISDLPGKEALYEPGKKAGQMKMIREPQGVVAYTWVDEGESSHWEKVGDVLGSADPNAGSKTTFEGKPYDFVFTVDVEDGKPPLKLPYNKGEDPYTAAHKFLEKNMLPAAYLDQVVNFILTNSAEANNTPVNPNYVDPFTGASRYTPMASATTSGNSGVNMDPFTGGSSYSSSLGSNTQNRQVENHYFPLKEYRSFDGGDPKVILGKLKEFNAKAGNGAVDEATLEKICSYCNGSVKDELSLDAFINLLNWSDDIVFPVLDILRLMVKFSDNNNILFTKDNGNIIKKLKYYISSDCKTPNCTLVAFRALCNMFLQTTSEQLIFQHRLDLLENITSLNQINKNVEIALTTFLLNLSILSIKFEDEFGILLLTNVVPDMVIALNDCEAQFRGLIAIGTLLTVGNADQKKLIKEKMFENTKFLEKLYEWSQNHSNDAEMKRRNCAKQVLLYTNV